MASERLLICVFAAFLYGLSSFLITVVNKVVLTSYKFPSYQFLAFGQMVFGIVLLGTGKFFKIVSFPDLDRTLPRRIWPLPLVFILNLVTGLGGTQKLSLPMFTVLRRFSILFTMIGEFLILGVRAPMNIQLCIYLMVFGAIVAGFFDLAFDLMGYTFVLVNNVFTAANGVYTKKKLDAKDLGELGLIYYNSLFMIVPFAAIVLASGEFTLALEFQGWSNPWFLFYFVLASVMGFILTFSIIFCTNHNSALTTTVIGVLKNLLITYIGMFIGGDYIFSWANFFGLNVSVVGSILYTYIAFRSKSLKPVILPTIDKDVINSQTVPTQFEKHAPSQLVISDEHYSSEKSKDLPK